MRAMAGTIARHTSIRQCVSLAIVVFTIASVFVLKYLDNEGQWSQLQRMDPAGNNHSSAGGIVKSQASVQSQHGPSVKGRWRIEDAAVQFRPEELGFSSSEIIRSNVSKESGGGGWGVGGGRWNMRDPDMGGGGGGGVEKTQFGVVVVKSIDLLIVLVSEWTSGD